MQASPSQDTTEPTHIPSGRAWRSLNTKRVDCAPGAPAGSRKLLATKPNASLASSTFCNPQRRLPSLNLSTSCADIKNDAISPIVSGKTVRPLPPIPKSAPPALETSRQAHSSPLRRLRPLPSPPLSSPSSTDTSSLLGTSQYITPATSVEDLHHPQSRSQQSLPMLPPLDSPSLPMPPTLQTAKRRRIEKLRRHLGELIPEDGVDRIIPRSANTKAQVLRGVQKSEIRSYVTAAIATEKILEFSFAKDEDDDSEYSGCGESYDAGSEGGEDSLATQSYARDDYTWVVENGTAFRAGNRRYSAKWVHEKGGRRQVERDYKQILSALRAL